MMRDFNLVVNICLFPFLNDARFQLRSFLFGFLCYPFVSISFITLHIVLPFAFVAALILGVVKQVCRMERRNGVRSELHPYAWPTARTKRRSQKESQQPRHQSEASAYGPAVVFGCGRGHTRLFEHRKSHFVVLPCVWNHQLLWGTL